MLYIYIYISYRTYIKKPHHTELLYANLTVQRFNKLYKFKEYFYDDFNWNKYITFYKFKILLKIQFEVFIFIFNTHIIYQYIIYFNLIETPHSV